MVTVSKNKCCAFVLGFAVLVSAGAPTSAETIATFTRNPSNPILRVGRAAQVISIRYISGRR